jgi:hypothetical protein
VRRKKCNFLDGKALLASPATVFPLSRIVLTLFFSSLGRIEKWHTTLNYVTKRENPFVGPMDISTLTRGLEWPESDWK